MPLVNKFCVSCYMEEVAVYCIPLEANELCIKEKLNRGDFPINGVPLTKSELHKLAETVSPDIEIGWDETLSFYLESVTLQQ